MLLRPKQDLKGKTAKLAQGTAVEIRELGPGWTRVTTPAGDGFLPDKALAKMCKLKRAEVAEAAPAPAEPAPVSPPPELPVAIAADQSTDTSGSTPSAAPPVPPTLEGVQPTPLETATATSAPPTSEPTAEAAATPPVAAPATPKSPVQQALESGKNLLVLDPKVTGDITVEPSLLATSIAEEIAKHAGIPAATLSDIKDVAMLAQTREAMGCEEDAQCLARITKALNADLVLSSTVGRVGSSVVLTVSLTDSTAATPLGRASETVGDADSIGTGMSAALSSLFGWGGAVAGPRYQLPQGGKVSFAVFDLKAAGVSPEVVQNLTQVLSVEIKRIEGTSVVSRDDVMAMLQLEKDKSILTCSDDMACIAEIGGALGVDKLVVGQVGRLADSYVVSLRLIDARQVRVDNRVSESFRGQEDQLLRAVRHGGRRLLGLEATGNGSVAVSAEQPGATVFVDEVAKGEVPLPPIADVPVGRHTVRVSKDGFFDWQSEVFVDPGETTPLWASLTEAPAPWFKKWWVWTIVGGVVVAGATTALLLSQSAPSTSGGTMTVGGN